MTPRYPLGVEKERYPWRVNVSVKLYIDNQSTLSIMKSGQFSRRSRHIDVKFHFLCDLVSSKQIEVYYCPTDLQVADILTKPLTHTIFDKFRNVIVKNIVLDN